MFTLFLGSGVVALTGSLSAAQTDEYWRNGYLFPLDLMHPAEAQTWLGKFTQFEERYRDDPALRQPFENYLRANLHVVSTAAAELAHHPAILDAVESIIGPDLLCWMVELIIKEPHSDAMLTTHQDLTYWGLDGADGVVTAWVALSDVTSANGAMHMVRGSHRLGQVDHEDTFGVGNVLSRGQRAIVEHDPSDEVIVELAPGQVSLHHGLMLHGSRPNESDARRVGVVIRYIEPEVRQRVSERDYAMVVRGSNHTGHLISIAPPSANCDAGSLDLFEEITAAQSPALGEGAAAPIDYQR